MTPPNKEEAAEPVAWTRQRSLDRLEEHGMIIAISGPGPDDSYSVPLFTADEPGLWRFWNNKAREQAATIDAMRETLLAAQQAINDWVCVYAPDECRPEHVAAARSRLNEGGTLAYQAEVLDKIRASLNGGQDVY